MDTHIHHKHTYISNIYGTYNTKDCYGTDPYVRCVYNNRGHRSALAQFRSGILPLGIETGRFLNIPREFRLYIMCDKNEIEDETHFLFQCKMYDELREILYIIVQPRFPKFEPLPNKERFKILMS